jgi:hypothetical protein
VQQATVTAQATPQASAQRRPGAGRRGGGTPGSDPLPLESAAKRHRAIQAEIDAMEGNFSSGPR